MRKAFSQFIGVILAVAVIAGCASSSAYQAAVIGATEADRQFVQTGQLYDRLLAEGKISESEYNGWAVFALRYKVVSDQAYRTLVAAKDSQDVASTVAIVQALFTELALFYAYGIEKEGS